MATQEPCSEHEKILQKSNCHLHISMYACMSLHRILQTLVAAIPKVMPDVHCQFLEQTNPHTPQESPQYELNPTCFSLQPTWKCTRHICKIGRAACTKVQVHGYKPVLAQFK